MNLPTLSDCAICYNYYWKPKLLPCLHTFCLTCLNKYAEGKVSGESMECPKCSGSFALPSGGVKKLPNNDFAARCVLNKRVKSKDKISCEVCQGVKRSKQAKFYCQNCGQYLCGTCNLQHGSCNTTKSHNLSSTQMKPLEAHLKRLETSYCERHDEVLAKLYCFTCRSSICENCSSYHHNTHDCKVLKEISENEKTKIANDRRDIQGCKSKLSKTVKKLDKEKLEFLANISSIESAINKRCSSIGTQGEASEQSFLQELNDIKSERLLEIRLLTHYQKLLVERLQWFLQCSELMARHGTDYETVRVADIIHSSAADLIKTQKELEKEILTEKLLEFLEAPPITVEQVKPLIGHIIYRDLHPKPGTTETADKGARLFLTQGYTLDVIQGGRHVTGVTVLDEEVFVTRYRQAKINVYGLKSHELARDVDVVGLKDPVSLAGCERTLYCSDWENACIHRIDPISGGTTSWTLHGHGRPRGVSITSENNPLVTQCQKQGRCALVEYSSAGQVRRIIKIDNSIEFVYQAVKLANNDFAMCCKGNSKCIKICCVNDTKTAKSQCRVQICDINWKKLVGKENDKISKSEKKGKEDNGEKLNTEYIEKPETGKIEQDKKVGNENKEVGKNVITETNTDHETINSTFSYSLVTDSQSKDKECILVADYSVGGVHMFAGNGEYLGRILAGKGDLKHPTCIHYNSSTGYLVVGEETGRLTVVKPQEEVVKQR